MTVSAALRRIKKIKGLIADRTTRAKASVVYMDTKEPGFAFGASLEERATFVRDLVKLQSAVAVANAATLLSDGKTTVAHAIRSLDEKKAEIAIYKELPVRAKETEIEIEEDTEWSPTGARVRVERKKTWRSAITQAKRAEIVERLTSEFEVLNNEVEALNNRIVVEVDLSAP
jgi:hypothetical protein